MTDPAGEVAAFARARAAVLSTIAGACARVGREPAEVTVVAVSKTVAADRVRAAVEAGFTVLGENRVQEAVAKIPLVDGATWHLVGPLQSNKVRRAVEAFDVIEAVDSIDLARRLDRIAAEVRPTSPVPIFLEVNVDGDPAKSGLAPPAVRPALDALAELPGLRAEGLMTIGRLVADPQAARPTFATLRGLSESLRSGTHGAVLGSALSMGMTDDYPVAVEEGATIVRIGRAIFGERPHHHDGGPEHRHEA